ncbi:hypothetical protein C6Q14_12920 [Burkholderia ambifaria]|nr:hypothetical protein C6Q14_12920 [Burkholderia ambifaria]
MYGLDVHAALHRKRAALHPGCTAQAPPKCLCKANGKRRRDRPCGKARPVTCTKRTRMAEKAKNASKFINPPKIRTTRIEPSAALHWMRWNPRFGGPRASVSRPLFFVTDALCRTPSLSSRSPLPSATRRCAAPS